MCEDDHGMLAATLGRIELHCDCVTVAREAALPDRPVRTPRAHGAEDQSGEKRQDHETQDGDIDDQSSSLAVSGHGSISDRHTTILSLLTNGRSIRSAQLFHSEKLAIRRNSSG